MPKKSVLILCTGNSCRSQMAEGILRHYQGEQYDVFSAGTKPSNVNAIAIKVMKEIGIDISGYRSKYVDEFKDQKIDIVVTVCDNAKESCPVFLGDAKRYHWLFPDPPHNAEITEEVIQEFRLVRDLIKERFREFKL
jgi:arsenate reductase